MTVEEVAAVFNATKAGDRYGACCPCHDDKHGSLSIRAGDDGRVLVHCFAGCAVKDIVAAKGLTMRDLFPAPAVAGKVPRKVVATYDYRTRDGAPLIRVVRYVPKSFGRYSWDGHGWARGNTEGVAALYRWPELRAACLARVRRVLLVEGEKDVDNMVKLLAAAPKDGGGKPKDAPFDEVTTALGGSSKWRVEYAPEFAGVKEVVVVADRDGAGNRFKGQRYAIQVRDALRENGIAARAVLLPAEIGGRAVKDASDAIAAGWGLADFGNWLAGAEDLCAADFEQKAEASSGDGSMKSAIDEAVLEAIRKLDGGRLKDRDESEIVSRVGRQWLAGHGRFYIDRDRKSILGAYYFYAPEKRLFAIGNKPDEPGYFNAWLSVMSGKSRARGAFRQLLLDCQNDATASRITTEFTPSRFWERRGDVVYISCGEGQVCRIEAGRSPEMVDNGTDGVLFMSEYTLRHWELLPYDKEVSPLSLAIFRDMTVIEERYMLLFLFWVLALPLDLENKPPLVLNGTVGSGKTRAAKGVFEMFGFPAPRVATIRADGEKDFWNSVNQGGLLVLDNCDKMFPWLANAIASAATGGTNEVRELYTNNGVILQKARAAIIVTTANPTFASDPGTADRIEMVRLDRNDRETADSELTADIERNRDGCMTWIAHVLQLALENKGRMPPATMNRRHPDWGAWAWRFGAALGCEDAARRVLCAAEEDKSRAFVEQDAFAAELTEYMKTTAGKVMANATGLAESLRKSAESGGRSFKLSSKAVGKRIAAGWPHYRQVFRAEKVLDRNKVWFYTFYPATEDSASADDSGAFDGGGSAVDGGDGNDNN